MVIKWEVSHNSKDGQPGPLAYKLDTLIINRRIEETARPISRIIKLGSLREITEELGLTTHNDSIKRSLHQNASTYIKAKIRYRLADGTEKDLEAGFTRYSVVFTGEKLPNGRKADAVYIVLNDVYMQVINGAVTRPLDYDYLKTLPPGPQRFYEILSFQIYAAIRNDRPRAKLLYSEFCTYAPMTRHEDWTRVRSQMNKIHRPHFDSGYIAKVDYQDTTDGDGKARLDHALSARSQGEGRIPHLHQAGRPRRSGGGSLHRRPRAAARRHAGLAPGIGADRARRHAGRRRRAGADTTTRPESGHRSSTWIGWSPRSRRRSREPAGWLVSAIKTGHAAPKGFVSKAERQRREEAKQAKERQAAEERRRKQEQDDRDREERRRIEAHWDGMTTQEQAAFDATAQGEADPETLKLLTGPMKKIGVKIIRDQAIARLLRSMGELPPATE